MSHLHTDISQARAMAHAAVQLQYRAAKANLDPAPDDSHTSLSWADGTFRTLPFREGTSVEITLNPLTLRLGNIAGLSLNGVTYADALNWLDDQLQSRCHAKASDSNVTYDLPAEVTAINYFANIPGLEALEAWYDLAETAIGDIVSSFGQLSPGPVRCWPHHFDLASYFRLSDGDPETAQGVGVGLSPGDGYYDEPYFYVNPWPYPAPDALPPTPKPGHWHTRDFVGQIATGSQLLATNDVKATLGRFLEEAMLSSCSILEGMKA